MNTNNSVALITGSTRGIGKAIALELSNNGYTVVITGTRQEAMDQVVDEVETAGGKAFGLVEDLLAEGAVKRIFQGVLDQFGRLDVLVNNAGMIHAGPFEEISGDDFEKVMGLNVKVPMLLSQAFLPTLLKSQEKVIVNVTSVVGHKAYANQTLYSSSKFALTGMMTALAKEYLKQGLRVYNIAPGGVATDMILTARPDLDPDILIQPADVARTVAFLLSLKGNAQVDEIHIRRKDNTPFE